MSDLIKKSESIVDNATSELLTICKLSDDTSLALIDVNEEMQTRIADLEQQLKQQWVSVEDELPDQRAEVLFYIKELDQIELGKYNEHTKKWVKPYSDTYFMSGLNWVTHWMPLPKPPTK